MRLDGADLETNCHYYIGLSLFGLVRLDTRVDEVYQFIEDGLREVCHRTML
jgi:hypothetical protein